MDDRVRAEIGDHVIEVEDLWFTYPGTETATVRGMSFAVERGEIFGFLGPSGAGKTTTQQILIGLIEGWTGAVNLFGRPVNEWGPELYDRIGVSFELPVGYAKLTVREDLHHFSRLHGTVPRDADEMIDAVGLSEARNREVGHLSKGMRVRLNLARAMLHDPDLLFLDEPTSGLDPVTARSVRRLLEQERDRGATIFLTTHDMITADELCDRVAFVVDGTIAACGSPRGLRLDRRSRQLRVEYRDAGELRTDLFDLDSPNGDLTRLMTSGCIETIHSTESSLEDVFVDVTGRPL